MFSVLLVLCCRRTLRCGFSSAVPDDRSGRLSSAFFGGRGRRLVFSQGIWGLAILAALLLILFGA